MASVAGILTGCMPDMANMEMGPQRPPELEQLNPFVGNWTGEMEMTMVGSGEVMKATGTSEAKWEGDGWYLVNRMVADMGEAGEMKAIETWVYDQGSRLFRRIGLPQGFDGDATNGAVAVDRPDDRLPVVLAAAVDKHVTALIHAANLYRILVVVQSDENLTIVHVRCSFGLGGLVSRRCSIN